MDALSLNPDDLSVETFEPLEPAAYLIAPVGIVSTDQVPRCNQYVAIVETDQVPRCQQQYVALEPVAAPVRAY